MKKLIGFIFVALISVSFYADARLVSGTAQHQHDSATGGGNTLSGTTISAPIISSLVTTSPIFSFDSAQAVNEKYWRFGQQGADFVIQTSNDDKNSFTQALAFIRGSGNTIDRANFGDVFISSTKACATNFVRVNPNLCIRSNNSARTFVSLTRDSCTQVSSPTGDTTPKALILVLHAAAISANVAGVRRDSFITSWNSATCDSIESARVLASAYEFNAVTAGAVLDYAETYIITQNYTTFLKFVDDVGNNGEGNYWIYGYYD